MTPARGFDNNTSVRGKRAAGEPSGGDSGISNAEGIVSILRVGATKKFSDGWEQAFGGKKKPAAKSAPAVAAKPAAAAKATKKAKPSTKVKSASVKKKKK